jgi:hypothetical protein
VNISLKTLCLGLTLSVSLPLASQATAGPTTEALSACMVRSATPADHLILAKWIFAIMSRHPAVSNMANLTEAQRLAINKDGGNLMIRLLATDCAAETKAAYIADGEEAIGNAFGSLGEIAMTDLMSDPNVQSELGKLTEYTDLAPLVKVFSEAQSAKK